MSMMRATVTHRSTHPQEVAFVLLDLVADVLVEEQLAEDEGAHGLHIQTLRLRQDLLISSVDGSTLFLMLEEEIDLILLTLLSLRTLRLFKLVTVRQYQY